MGVWLRESSGVGGVSVGGGVEPVVRSHTVVAVTVAVTVTRVRAMERVK